MLRRTFLTLVLAAAALPAADAPLVTAVDSVGLTVSDLDRSVAFYSHVLGFEKVGETEVAGDEYEHLTGVFAMRARVARMRLGGEWIELWEYLAPRGRPALADAHSNDRSFQHIAIIVSDMDKAYAWLRENKVQYASSGPQRLPDWNKAAGGIRAFYFRDPDGHPLEVLEFPEGKGDPKWHRPTDKLFLGIDHTAIVVSDTEASLRFYRDLLGLRVAGESENYGPEQERLNSVFGARLRITSLRSGSGPGVEFLEYLAPRNGRPYPADAAPNDLVHWQTEFLGTSVEKTVESLRRAHAAFVSTGAVEFHDAAAGARKSVIVRDPDGHALQIAAQ